MFTSLFVRSYPAPGVRATPVTYNSGPYGYFVVCLIPVMTICFFVAVLTHYGPKLSWTISAIVTGVAICGLAVSFLRALRLDITNEGVSYTNPLRGTKFVAFCEMSGVVLLDYRQESRGAPGSE